MVRAVGGGPERGESPHAFEKNPGNSQLGRKVSETASSGFPEATPRSDSKKLGIRQLSNRVVSYPMKGLKKLAKMLKFYFPKTR